MMRVEGLKGLPDGLNWNASVGLLLDGVSVRNLPRQLYRWLGNPEFEPLYLGTCWKELIDLSPCFIRIASRNNPALDEFLANLRQEWGYLLVSNRPWSEQLDHLRWLVNVRHPQGENVMLRFADPAVGMALFSHAERLNDVALFGPFSQIVVADPVRDCWHLMKRPGPVPDAHYDLPYALSDDQLALIEEAAFSRIVMRVEQHLGEQFPAFQQASTMTTWEQARHLAKTAYGRGFFSEQDILLYANIHGYLGEQALQEHPDLEMQLSGLPAGSATDQLKKVARLAADRAALAPANP